MPIWVSAKDWYLFGVIATRANGARTSVRRNVGWRKGVDISQGESAVPALLRDGMIGYVLDIS